MRSVKGWRFLGERERDMSDRGRDEVQRRFFFHARYDGLDASERWRWVERFPSEGPDPEVVFELFWAPLWPDSPGLVAGQGALLNAIARAGR